MATYMNEPVCWYATQGAKATTDSVVDPMIDHYDILANVIKVLGSSLPVQ